MDLAASGRSCRADICRVIRARLDRDQAVPGSGLPAFPPHKGAQAGGPGERKMRVGLVIGALLLAALCCEPPAFAQAAAEQTPQIAWEVKSRFRLFRNERD